MHPGNSRGLLSVLMGELMQEPAPKKFGKNPNIQIFAGGKKVHETVGPFLQGQDDHRRFEELTFKPSSAQLSVKPASKPLLHQSANGTIQIFKR
jgi:hypothetical protein